MFLGHPALISLISFRPKDTCTDGLVSLPTGRDFSTCQLIPEIPTIHYCILCILILQLLCETISNYIVVFLEEAWRSLLQACWETLLGLLRLLRGLEVGRSKQTRFGLDAGPTGTVDQGSNLSSARLGAVSSKMPPNFTPEDESLSALARPWLALHLFSGSRELEKAEAQVPTVSGFGSENHTLSGFWNKRPKTVCT